MAISDRIYISSVSNPSLEFDSETIESIVIENSLDVIGNELFTDVMEVSVFYDDSGNNLRGVARGTPIWYYSEQLMRGKYYVKSVERTAPEKYLIRATSMIGLIAEEEFYGGYYSGTDFKEVLNDILFSDGFNGEIYDLYADGYQSRAAMAWLRSVELSPSLHNENTWNYKMHCEFTIEGMTAWASTSSDTSSYVAGYYRGVAESGVYDIYVRSSKDDTSGNYYHCVYLIYGTTSLRCGYINDDHIYMGDGTKFTVDVDPVKGTATIRADYISCRDPSEAGTITKSGNISAVTGASYYPHLGYVGGAGQYSTYYERHNGMIITGHFIVYHSYQIYDQNGRQVMNAAYGIGESTGTAYYVNMANGDTVPVDSDYYPEAYGTDYIACKNLSIFSSRMDLYKSINYAEDVDTISVYGWIPICTKREALHQLLFAYNICLLKTAGGNILLSHLSDAAPTEIDDDKIFNDTQEEYVSAARSISVTENTYVENSATKTLFDNSTSQLPSGEYIAEFADAPVFGSLSASGINIIASNCNAARVTGIGTITGKAYNKMQKVIVYENSGASEGNDVSVSGIGLITYLNSESVLEKMINYYSGAVTKIRESIVSNGERCGVRYSFKSLFEDENTGYLSKISSKISSFIKNVCEFVSGFVPISESGYSNNTILLSGNEWTVPEDVKAQSSPTVKLVVIGDGKNGASGAAGSAGTAGGNGGAGGAGGSGGAGGKIYQIIVNVANVTKIAVSNSNGEVVATAYNGSSSVGSYSSANGAISGDGFLDILTGTIYALRGIDGVAGGNGGNGRSIAYTNRDYDRAYGNSGSDVGSYKGGRGTYGHYVEGVEQGTSGTAVAYYSRGQAGGGGASAAANGGDAYESGTSSYTIMSGYPTVTVYNTHGGNGAAGGTASGTYLTYGSGGNGGNGGGGGGGGGTDTMKAENASAQTIKRPAGSGGAGGSGSSGIQGCVIIYY